MPYAVPLGHAVFLLKGELPHGRVAGHDCAWSQQQAVCQGYTNSFRPSVQGFLPRNYNLADDFNTPDGGVLQGRLESTKVPDRCPAVRLRQLPPEQFQVVWEVIDLVLELKALPGN